MDHLTNANALASIKYCGVSYFNLASLSCSHAKYNIVASFCLPVCALDFQQPSFCGSKHISRTSPPDLPTIFCFELMRNVRPPRVCQGFGAGMPLWSSWTQAGVSVCGQLPLCTKSDRNNMRRSKVSPNKANAEKHPV